jgi:hypothetical protein
MRACRSFALDLIRTFADISLARLPLFYIRLVLMLLQLSKKHYYSIVTGFLMTCLGHSFLVVLELRLTYHFVTQRLHLRDSLHL